MLQSRLVVVARNFVFRCADFSKLGWGRDTISAHLGSFFWGGNLARILLVILQTSQLGSLRTLVNKLYLLVGLAFVFVQE